jgi:GNAT superfamily N-acetyltransferase
MVEAGVDPAALQVSRLRHQDIEACICVACASFDHFEHDADVLRHWFEARVTRNPWQQAIDGIGVGIRHRGRLIAFRAMFAQPWWLEGRETVLAFAAHTSIDPAFRGAGLGSRLIAASRECAEITGSTSAGDITQKVYRKQGFFAIGGEGNDFFRLRVSYVGSMKSRLGAALGQWAGRACDALGTGVEVNLRDDRGFLLESVDRCDPEFDELWLRARAGYPSCLERSSRYLNWRLFDAPTHPLALLALRDVSRRLRAWGVWHELRYSRHVSCAVLRDLFVAVDDDVALDAFLRQAILHWRRCGLAWANLEVASPHMTQRFRAAGYEHVPSIGNRYHVHSRQPLAESTAGQWFRSGLDGDYFDTRMPEAVDAPRPN